MAKLNKSIAIAVILALVLSLGTLFLPAHRALALSPVYVDVTNGSDSYDGSSPTDEGGGVGPVATIAHGFTLVNSGGTISVAAGTYPEHLTFDKSFTLAGHSATDTFITGSDTSPSVIQVDDNSEGSVSVTISEVRIRQGNYGGGTGGLGIIASNGHTTTVTVNDCNIDGNTGRNGGGVGVGYHCTLYMDRCAIFDNTVGSSGYGGGGINNAGGVVNLTNCTIGPNNTVNSDGSPTQYGYGGGIANYPYDVYGGNVTVMNCTIANNIAGDTPGYGGGFYNGEYGTMTFENTIVAYNVGSGGLNNGYNESGSHPGTVVSNGYNIDSLDDCGFHNTLNGDQVNTDPLLQTLNDNGGPTYTFAIPATSPAKDTGYCIQGMDQRAVPRPQGPQCDIGAFEYESSPFISSVSPRWGYLGQTADFVINGSDLNGNGAYTSVSFGDGITVNSLNINSNVQITVNLTIAADASLGTRTVQVTNLGGTGNRPDAFTVYVTPLLSTAYVNSVTGSDTWTGTSPTHTTGNIGPKQTISSAYDVLDDGGTINLAACTFPEHNLTFTKSLTLAGTYAPGTIIDGSNTDGVIKVDELPATTVSVTISDLTMENGNEDTFAGGLTVTGGATVTVNDCVIKDNTGVRGGGVGVNQDCTLNMNRCTVSGNTTQSSGSGGSGIYNFDGGAVNLTNCTISGNTITNALIGWSQGAGIENYSGGQVTLENCTLADNHINSAVGPAQGGGFYNGSGSTMVFQNTIVAGNTANGGGNNGSNGGTVTSNGYNIDSLNECGFTGTGDLVNTNPNLGPLQDNGGPTLTMALPAGSPAIDTGTSVSGVTTDQCGVARPQGSGCDRGAYELATAPAVPTLKSPATGATVSTITPRLEWNPPLRGATYNIQIATASTFAPASLVVSDSRTHLYYDVAGGLTWAKTYYWRVNARNGGGTSAWSAYRTFKTSVVPPPNPRSDLTATASPPTKCGSTGTTTPATRRASR